MTEDDDAFIRTIVDGPGNDLPRLVYADWLDDRDDPRGPFLRAEVEWAQPWKDGQRPGDASELRATATGSDPLWVARVARPPLGVCADHVGFRDPGPHLTAQQLKNLATRIGVPLPVELTAFFLNWNGGVLQANRRPHPLILSWESELQPWYSVGASPRCPADRDFAAQSNKYQRNRCPIRRTLALLCAADGGYYEQIGIGLVGERRGQICHIVCNSLSEFAPDPVVVAQSLADFLADLRAAAIPEPSPPAASNVKRRTKRKE